MALAAAEVDGGSGSSHVSPSAAELRAQKSADIFDAVATLKNLKTASKTAFSPPTSEPNMLGQPHPQPNLSPNADSCRPPCSAIT